MKGRVGAPPSLGMMKVWQSQSSPLGMKGVNWVKLSTLSPGHSERGDINQLCSHFPTYVKKNACDYLKCISYFIVGIRP